MGAVAPQHHTTLTAAIAFPVALPKGRAPEVGSRPRAEDVAAGIVTKTRAVRPRLPGWGYKPSLRHRLNGRVGAHDFNAK